MMRSLFAAALALALLLPATAHAQVFCSGTPVLTSPAGTTVGPFNPYPSTVTVSGITGTVTDVDISILGFNHTFPDDIDIFVAAPSGADSYLMSDAGLSGDLVGVDLVFDDEAAGLIPDTDQIVTGSYQPANWGIIADPFSAPAPLQSGNTLLSAFDGADPNGTWNLWGDDDVGGDVGDFTDWCVTLTVEAPPPPPRLPDVDIAYISSTAEPQRSDQVFIRARVTNNETITVRTRVYFEVLYPDGRTRRYSVLSKDLPAGASIQVQTVKQMKFPLAADAPAGAYTVTLYAAQDQASGGAVYDSASFTFDLGPISGCAAACKTGDLASSPEAGPNPFTRETAIRYSLEADADVDLRVFDARGRAVATLASGVQTAGEHRAVFAAGALPGGVYVWRLAIGGEVQTGRVTLAR